MADLRIVDAPVLLQESITDDVKMPTGGLGNFSIRLGDIVWYVVTKEQLANKNYVDLSSKGVKDSLDEHIADKANPHQVTKTQVGLGNVDNTADIDKPVSNAVNSAIITATTDMATKTYVNQKDNLKADVAYVDGKDGDLTTLTTNDKTNLVKAVNEIHDVTKGVVALYDKNVEAAAAGAGANGWTADLVLDKSGKTQQEINNYRPTIFQLSDVVGNGVADDTIEIQKAFRYIDDNKKSYIFLPFFSNNYFIDTPIVLQEPAGVIGDKSPTYNRGGGKDGWVLVGTNATHAFDFGNYRTYDANVADVDLKKSKNPADTWLVKGIGIKKHSSVIGSRTKDGILFTSKTDGPDRSITVQEFSAYNLNRAIYVPVTTASVSSASFNVSNCNLSGNNYGIYHEARSYSTLIVGNQIEQNYVGGIYGCFDGVTTIRDNMLEGQPNAINIVNHPTYKSQSRTTIEGNYFEHNSGDYVIRMEGINGSRLTLRNNWMLSNNAAEYCLIGAGTRTVLENYDLELVTIENNVFLGPGTKLTALPNYSINYKKTASSGVYAGIRHDPKDLGYTDDPAYKPILPSITRAVGKFQNQLCYVSDTNATLYSPTAVTIGDMLEISVLLYCDTAPPAGLSVYLVNNSQMITSFSPGLMGGKWVVTTFVVDALSTQPQIYAYADIAEATGGVGIKFAAASIKNHGQVELNSKINVKPCIPKLHTISGKALYKAAYTGFTLASGATKAATLHQFTTPEGLAIGLGDLVKSSLSVDLQGLDIYAEATTNSQVKVWFKNNTAGSVTIPDSTLRIILM